MSLRMKDISRYTDVGRQRDQSSRLNRLGEEPPELFDIEISFKIFISLWEKDLLKINITGNRVEEFQTEFNDKEEIWRSLNTFSPNDLFFMPVYALKGKLVWFFLTLLSSAISFYSREILDNIGLLLDF